MTVGLADPPVLVLGVGNLLLQDDGVGLRLLDELSTRGFGNEVEFVDGGTQGLALLGHLAGREVLIVLDAVKLGDPPGAIHVLRGADLEQLRARRSSTSHESNALELMAYAQLIGTLPPEVIVIGIEPENIRTGIGLSPTVESALPAAIACASGIIVNARRKLACA